ncbi:MAG: tRNA adenosine(34) deaminase TadA [Myxococcota bacterium]
MTRLTAGGQAINTMLAPREGASIFEWTGMVPTEDQRFMDQALAQAAAAANMGEVPVGAVVVHEGVVISQAHNRREVDGDPTAHAELIAMRDAAQVLGDWRLEECTVYVTLEPCAMCAGLMVNARVARCVYAAPDPRGGFLGTLADLSSHPVLNHRFEVASGVRSDESADMLRSFFRKVRAKK